MEPEIITLQKYGLTKRVMVVQEMEGFKVVLDAGYKKHILSDGFIERHRKESGNEH